MAEFYVVPDCRRAGVGARAAAEIIDSLPASWEIGISASHDAARAFWAHVVRRIPGALPHWSEGDGERWAGPILNFRAAGRRGWNIRNGPDFYSTAAGTYRGGYKILTTSTTVAAA